MAGENSISVKATDIYGYTATAEITVYAQTAGNYIRITAAAESGVSFFETDLTVESTSDFDQEPSISANDPDAVDYLDSMGDDRYNIGISTPDIYYISAEATDEEARVYTDTVALVVMDLVKMDAMLRTKWNGMKTSLINGDITGVLTYSYESARGNYEEIFNTLSSDISEIASTMRDIELIYSEERITKYRIKKQELVQGQNYDMSYYIYFIKDHNGLWRIQSS